MTLAVAVALHGNTLAALFLSQVRERAIRSHLETGLGSKDAMQEYGLRCPRCHADKSRKFWTPAQWRGRTAERETVEGKPAFVGCRECHSTASRVRAPTPERWLLPDVQGRRGLRVSTEEPTQEGVGAMEHNVRMLARLLKEAESHDFHGYVWSWMSLLERHRKEWSYVGGLFSREECDPVHDFVENTFDPGNWTYSKVLKMLCPRLLTGNGDRGQGALVDWSEEKQGDICEGIMGVFFLTLGTKPFENTPPPSVIPAHLLKDVGLYAKYLEKISYVTYRILEGTPEYKDTYLQEACERARGDGLNGEKEPARTTPQAAEEGWKGDPPRAENPWGSWKDEHAAAPSISGRMEPTPEEEHRLANVGWGEILVLASVGMRALEENPGRLKDAGVQEGARELARALGARCPERFAGDIDLNDVADLVKDVDIDMDETWKEARKGQARGQWRDYREEWWTARTEKQNQKWRHSYEPGHPYGQRGWHGARYGW